MKKVINKLRKTILANLKNGSIQNSDSTTKEFFITKIRAMKNLFEIEDVILGAKFKLENTHAITDVDLEELCYDITQSAEDVESYYKGLVHYDYDDAVFLQPHLFSWLEENSCLLNEGIAFLMLVIYKRLFGYDLQEVFDILQSNNPPEDDIDDYSNSTIEVYDDEDFTEEDGTFQDFIHNMISIIVLGGYLYNDIQENY